MLSDEQLKRILTNKSAFDLRLEYVHHCDEISSSNRLENPSYRPVVQTHPTSPLVQTHPRKK